MRSSHEIERCSRMVRISYEVDRDLFEDVRLETRRKVTEKSNRGLDRHSNCVLRNPSLETRRYRFLSSFLDITPCKEAESE
jgi:hypothetical protein